MKNLEEKLIKVTYKSKKSGEVYSKNILADDTEFAKTELINDLFFEEGIGMDEYEIINSIEL
jgi:hypothetical protein